MKEMGHEEMEKMLAKAAKKLAKEKAKEMGISEAEFEEKMAGMIEEAKAAQKDEGEGAPEKAQEAIKEGEEAKQAEPAEAAEPAAVAEDAEASVASE